MKSSLTAQDVLNDIEFELLQGALSRNELGQSIQTVRQYSNKMRVETLQSDKNMPELREILGKQFQVNDMLLTLLQEMAANQQALELTLQRLNTYRARHPETSDNLLSLPPDSSCERPVQDVQTAMAETLAVKPDVQPTHIPLVGAFVQRLKHAFHILVIYYLQNFAEKQTAVNRTYGDWILYLNTVNKHQEEELELLRRQLYTLRNNSSTR